MKVMVSYSYLAITINIIDHDLKGYAFFSFYQYLNKQKYYKTKIISINNVH